MILFTFVYLSLSHTYKSSTHFSSWLPEYWISVSIIFQSFSNEVHSTLPLYLNNNNILLCIQWKVCMVNWDPRSPNTCAASIPMLFALILFTTSVPKHLWHISGDVQYNGVRILTDLPSISSTDSINCPLLV